MDLAVEQGFSRSDELVSGDDDAHARRAVAPQLGYTRGGDGRQRERPQRLARRDHDGAGGHIRAAQAHVVSRLDRAVEGDVIPVGVRSLHGHDAVGAGRQRRAGRNRHGRVRREAVRVVARERPACDEQRGGRIDRPNGVAVHRGVVERRQVVRGMHVGRHDAADERARELDASRPAAARAARAGARRPRAGAADGDRGQPRAYAINGRVDGGPVAPATAHSLSGPALDAACRSVAGLAPHAAIAGPAWWDANAPARRVTYVRRVSAPLPPVPWPARRALDFCAELALALAPLHEAGVAQGELRPDARRHPARRRTARARPGGSCGCQ